MNEFIQNRSVCSNYKSKNDNFQKYRTSLTGAFDKVGIDLIGPLPKSDCGSYKYIIAATDYLTRWTEAEPIKSKKKEEISRFIFNRIFRRHGPPKELISDQGLEFLNDVVSDLCKRMNTSHSSVSAYSPRCNGTVERFNRTFLNKLTRFISEDLYKWPELVSVALYSYNISSITKLKASPFKMLYGRDPHDFTLNDLTGNDIKIKSLDELDRIRLELKKKAIEEKRKRFLNFLPQNHLKI